MKYRNDINGLRAIVVLIVVLFHFGVPGFQGGLIGVIAVVCGILLSFLFVRLSSSSALDTSFSFDSGHISVYRAQ